MDTSLAIKLIRGGVDTSISRQVWTDLGAGSGTFTKALAGLLDGGSVVYAVDVDLQALKQIKYSGKGARIVTINSDFIKDDSRMERSNGILMANSLHYVEDQFSFITKLKDQFLLPGGRMIVVEYERRTANRWIPFPLGFEQLKAMALRMGLSVVWLGEIPSVYDGGIIYGALIDASAP